MYHICPCLVFLAGWFFTPTPRVLRVEGTTYYMSNSVGDDSNDGLAPGTPFRTVSTVNGLDLQPGDKVLFKCGDVWQAGQLVISQSGTESAPITFGSYPQACTDKPILSAGGSQITDNELPGDDGKAALPLNDTVPRMRGRDEAADFTLAVYDPEGNPNETAALTFWVVAPIARVYRPLMAR